MKWNEALERLKEGNERFIQDRLEGKLKDTQRKQSLTGGQQPFAIVLSCADSRVVPELAFDCGLGELFVVRVAGNVPNPSSIASIEYAVAHLGTKLIVVMGHESCGAVGAAMAGGDNGQNLNHLLGFITPVIEKNPGVETQDIIKLNAINSANALIQNSTIISDFAENQEVRIVPAYYNLADGKVEFDLNETA